VSRRYPLRRLVANGANLTCVVKIIWGVNGADRGSGRGPWTVHVIFRPEEERVCGVEIGEFDKASNSRYADPEADGVTPVFRTNFHQFGSAKCI
jgi:hypothetical protein